jgi:hypothetical protein
MEIMKSNDAMSKGAGKRLSNSAVRRNFFMAFNGAKEANVVQEGCCCLVLLP